MTLEKARDLAELNLLSFVEADIKNGCKVQAHKAQLCTREDKRFNFCYQTWKNYIQFQKHIFFELGKVFYQIRPS